MKPSPPIGPACGLSLAGIRALPVALPIVGRADAIDGGRAGNLRRLLRIQHHRRPSAVACVIDRLPQQPTIGADRLVGLAQVLRWSGRAEPARNALTRALQANPAHPDARVRRDVPDPQRRRFRGRYRASLRR